MGLIFLTSNVGFPMTIGKDIYNPMPVVDGFIFSIDKKEILDLYGIDYEIKPRSEIQFIEVIIEEE